MTEKHDLIALVDMDGTLADYDLGMRESLLPLCNTVEQGVMANATDMHGLEKLGTHWEARMEMIKKLPGWWRNLRRIEDNFVMVNLMRSLGFGINILTKGPWSKSQAWAEKVEWCQEHIPDAEVHITGSQTGKGMVYGKVLFDDWPPYVESWLRWRPRGLAILPAQPWNEDFEHPNAIRWDGSPEAWDAIEARLKAFL